MRFLLIFALILVATLPAAETTPVGDLPAASKRRAWTWFGLRLEQAQQRAAEGGIRLLVVRRDGQDTPPAEQPQDSTVQAVVQAGVIIEASVRQPQLQEGTRDPALIPLLGLTEADAIVRAKALGRAVRTVARDGEYFPATMDYNESRLNLTVIAGLVVAIATG